MIMRMSQRINRSQNNTEKGGNSNYDQTHRNGDDPLDEGDNANAQNVEKDSPIVALEPEDNYNKIVSNTNNFMGSQSRKAGTMAN